jgi:hypothetical protein
VNNESWLIPARQLCWSKKTFHSRNLGEAPTQEKQSKDAAGRGKLVIAVVGDDGFSSDE